jgi:ribosome-associated toxin RatA of RatAB toxin-antitoxin module
MSGIDGRWRVRGAAVVCLAVGSLVAAASTAQPARPADEVRHRLATGEVVVTPALPPGASKEARGGTAVALMRASPAEVWRVIVDYRSHPRYYPRVTAADVVESDARRVIVRYQVSVSPFSFVFYMVKYPDPGRRRVEWHLADGRSHGLFRENSGYWQIDDADAGTSLVTYALAVRTMLPNFMTGDSERASLVDTVTALRKLVEPQQ